MAVKPRTPRTDLNYRAIIQRMTDVLDPLAEELSLPVRAVDESLEGFAWLSSRAEFGKGEADFDLASPGDTPEGIKAKFLRYLDSRCMGLIDETRQEIRAVDAPVDPSLALVVPETLEKNA